MPLVGSVSVLDRDAIHFSVVHGLRYAGILVLVIAGTGLALAYLGFVNRQHEYLVGRNFRLLSALASQSEYMLDARAKIFETSLQPDYKDLDDVTNRMPMGPEATARFGLTRDTSGFSLKPESSKPSPRPPPRLCQIGPILQPIFAPKLAQGAFDTLIFATQSGDTQLARQASGSLPQTISVRRPGQQ
jgi:hypothetical protein